MDAAELQKLDSHFKELCVKYKIEEHISKGRGHSVIKSRKVYHPKIEEPMNYWVALHEMGHVVNGAGGARLDREQDAWIWAVHNAIIEPTLDIRQRICSLLWRYLVRADTDELRDPTSPERFHAVMRWWDSSKLDALKVA